MEVAEQEVRHQAVMLTPLDKVVLVVFKERIAIKVVWLAIVQTH
jgi:hypothetical protein